MSFVTYFLLQVSSSGISSFGGSAYIQYLADEVNSFLEIQSGWSLLIPPQ